MTLSSPLNIFLPPDSPCPLYPSLTPFSCKAKGKCQNSLDSDS